MRVANGRLEYSKMNLSMVNRLVTLKGDCFDIAPQGKRTVAERDGTFHNFHLTDLVSGRGVLRISVCRGGPRDAYVPSIAEFDRREEVVVLNCIRRAFDSGEIGFDIPTQASHYNEISLQPSDFAKQPFKTDTEIRTYIIHKAYWLSFRHPIQSVSTNVMHPIQFDEMLDLEYLGATLADVLRNIQRLSNQGMLEKVLEANARPSEKLLQLYESGDFSALGFSSGPSPQSVSGSDDRKFARLAIDEARKSVSENDNKPHPWVGAVVVKDGKVLSKAHRGEVPGNHAEFVALERNLPDVAVAGATVYTTLEPCTTRNPPKIPCVDRLIERRVARVVIGILDADDRIRGKGQRKLSNAGIETSLFPHDLAMEVEELNREFIRFCEQNVRTEVGPANMELWKEVAGLRSEFAEFRQNVEARDKERAEFEHFPVNFLLNQGAPGSYIGFLKNESKYKVVIETIQIFRGDADHESPLTEAVKPRPTDDWKVEPGTSKTLYWGPQYDPIAMLKSLVLSPDPNFPNGRVIPIALVLMLNVEGKRLPKKYTQQVLMQGHQITPWGP